MLAKERLQKIISILERDGRIRINELQNIFPVTTETLRRDIALLEKQHIAKKVHGGAILSGTHIQASNFHIRKAQQQEAKTIIAELASQFIIENDTIMVDASTTVFYLSPYLQKKKNTMIITNSLQLLYALCHNSHSKIIGLGGEIDNKSYAFVGSQTMRQLDKLHASFSFISCHGIDMNLGLMDAFPEEATIKEKFLSNSDTRCLLIDNSKLGKKGAVKINSLNKIDYLITNKKPSIDWLDFFDSLSIKVIYPT